MNLICILVTIVALLGIQSVLGSLKVNVHDEDGEVIEQKLAGNVTEDSISLDYTKPDGTVISHIVDYKNGVELFSVVELGETERGQAVYQLLCFILPLNSEEYISPGAVAKLRQKYASSIRRADERLPTVVHLMPRQLQLSRSWWLSRRHLAALCSQAAAPTGSLHTSTDLLPALRRRRDDVSVGDLGGSVLPVNLTSTGAVCAAVAADAMRACACRYQICLPWYPCGLKYCPGRDVHSQSSGYRCGVRTCRRCHQFVFAVRRPALCMWDQQADNSVTWEETRGW